MKRLVLTTVFILMCSIAYGIDKEAGRYTASFLKSGVSARSAGMGGVGVAMCEGVDGLWANPSLLSNLSSRETIFMHHRWIEGIDFNYLCAGLPLKGAQGIACSLNMVNTGEIKRTTYSKQDGDGSKFKTGSMVITGGYGRRHSGIDLGASIKFITQRLDDKKASAIAGDIGALYKIRDFAVGVAVSNIAFTKMKFIKEEEVPPLVIKVGSSYKIGNGLIGIDISKPSDNSFQMNIGGQYQVNPVFLVRLGYDSSIDEGHGISGGFGISYRNLTFDGAYLPVGEFDSTFYLSISSKF